MNVIGAPIGDFSRRQGRETELSKETSGHRDRPRVGKERPAFEIVLVNPNKIGRGAGAGFDRVTVDLMRLEAPDAHFGSGITLQPIAHGERSAGQGPRGDNPCPGDPESAIDPHTWTSNVGCWTGGGELRFERFDQIIDALTGDGRHRDDRPRFGNGALDVLLDVDFRKLNEVRVGEIDAGDRDDAVCHAEEIENGEVFLGLRHPAFVCGNHKQGDVEPSGPGEHVLDESLVAGDVDEPHRVVADLSPRETEVDREASLFLLGPPIGVSPGERLYQGGLAVVDMPGRSDDWHQISASAAATIESSSGWADRRFTSAAPSLRVATTGVLWSARVLQTCSSRPFSRRTGVGIVRPGTEPAPGSDSPSTIAPTAPDALSTC